MPPPPTPPRAKQPPVHEMDFVIRRPPELAVAPFNDGMSGGMMMVRDQPSASMQSGHSDPPDWNSIDGDPRWSMLEQEPFGSLVPKSAKKPPKLSKSSGSKLDLNQRKGHLRVLVQHGYAIGHSDPYVRVSIGALGLQWSEASPPDQRPESGRELKGPESEVLREALRHGQHSFTRPEMWSFGLEDLQPTCFIEVDGTYWKPVNTRQELRTKTHPRSSDPFWDEELVFEESTLAEACVQRASNTQPRKSTATLALLLCAPHHTDCSEATPRSPFSCASRFSLRHL